MEWSDCLLGKKLRLILIIFYYVYDFFFFLNENDSFFRKFEHR